MSAFIVIVAAVAFAAGVFTGISVPKIISWFKNEKADIKAKL